MTFDREPDLDNANVGTPDKRISGITQFIKRVTKSVALFSFFEKGGLLHLCGRLRGSALSFVFSDGKPCSGVRGYQKVSTELPYSYYLITMFILEASLNTAVSALTQRRINMISKMLENVRKNCPLIHNITNYVTVNDCANIVIACGASPIMADDKDEVEDITTICGGLNINIGTLNNRTIESMILAGKRANELNHPVVFDPVGAGASKLRTDTARRLLDEVKFTVIRGNISEIKTLYQGKGNTKGVDADVADKVTEDNIDEVVAFAKAFSEKTGAVIAITGAIDIVADSNKAYVIRNGHTMMSSVTGTGCQLSAMTAAYVTANKDHPLEATVASVCAMGYAGEIAYSRLSTMDGNSTYRNYIIDAIYNMTPEKLKEGAKYEVR